MRVRVEQILKAVHLSNDIHLKQIHMHIDIALQCHIAII